jgi:hypothetical protein
MSIVQTSFVLDTIDKRGQEIEKMSNYIFRQNQNHKTLDKEIVSL